MTGAKGPKLVHGGGTFVYPVIQESRFLSLEPFSIDLALTGALSAEKVRVDVPSAFTLGISTEPAMMMRAAERLLDMGDDAIYHQSQEIIMGQMRSVIASMTIEEINKDRAKFETNVREHCATELNKLGLALINVNITNIEDSSGVIVAMGKKATAQVVQQAIIDVATHEKEGAIGKENQERDMAIGVANASRDRQIGTKAAEREAAIRTAEMHAERVSGENKAQQTEVASMAELQVARAEAFQKGQTKEKEAHAAVLEAEARALALAAMADAGRVEQETRAREEAPAKAMKAKTMVDAEAEAAQIKIKAAAQAEATLAQASAAARGEYEMLARKAEGLGMLVQNCGGPDKAFQLLMLDQLQPLARESAKAISNIKFDKVVVWDGGSSDGKGGSAASNFVRGLTGAVPPALDVLKHVGGFEGIDKLMPSSLMAAAGAGSGGAPSLTFDYAHEASEAFRAVFNSHDADSDGRLTLQELDHMLRADGPLSPTEGVRSALVAQREKFGGIAERDGGLLFTDLVSSLDWQTFQRS